MAGTYSERLLLAAAANAWTSWTCPAGMRAVIKSIVLTNNTTEPVTLGVFLAGAPFFVGSIPGTSALSSSTMTIALYQGEAVDAYTSTSSTVVTIGGFLFEDSSGRVAPPGETAVSDDPPAHLELGQLGG